MPFPAISFPDQAGRHYLSLGADNAHSSALGMTIDLARDYATSSAETPTMLLALHYGFDRSVPVPAGYGAGLTDALIAPALGNLPSIIVAPDSDGRDWTNAELRLKVAEAWNNLIEHYGIAPNRRIVVGYSLGGIAVWDFVQASDFEFTAAVPISARAPETETLENWRPTCPLHVIHSARDELFDLTAVRDATQQIITTGQALTLNAIDAPTHFDVSGFVDPLRKAVPWLRRVMES